MLCQSATGSAPLVTMVSIGYVLGPYYAYYVLGTVSALPISVKGKMDSMKWIEGLAAQRGETGAS